MQSFCLRRVNIVWDWEIAVFFSHILFFKNDSIPSHPMRRFQKKQDNMNAMLEGVTVTGRDGKVTNLEQAGTLEAAKSQSQILGHVKAFVGKVLDWDLYSSFLWFFEVIGCSILIIERVFVVLCNLKHQASLYIRFWFTVNFSIFRCKATDLQRNFIDVLQLQVYLRGSQIRYFILPDMLRHAPMFKKKAHWTQQKPRANGDWR